MFKKLLNSVLQDDITTEKIFEWLTADNPLDIVFPDVVQNESTRVEFVLHFLSYLRDQTHEVLEPGASETTDVPSTPSKKEKIINLNDKSNNKIQVKQNFNRQENLESKFSRLGLSNESNTVSISPGRQPVNCQTSTPVKTILQNVNRGFNNYERSPITGIVVSPQFPASPTTHHHQDNQTINFNNSSASARSNDSFGDASTTDFTSPQRTKNSFLNDSIISNSSTVPCSPISPIYTTQIQSRNTGKNYRRSGNKSMDLLDLDKSKNKRTTLTLADFVTVKTSKKDDKKENNSDNKSRSKRRIKPTQLNVSGGQDNQHQEVFGVITRPATKNPQFCAAEPADAEEKIASFETERELLKLERQRLIKTDNLEANCLEQKCPIKAKISSVIVPKLELVEDVEILDTLARLHGGLISRNLVPNPMSELYFIISLLTTQFKLPNEGLESNADVTPTSTDSLKKLKEKMGCQDLSEENTSQEDVENKTKEKSTLDTIQYLGTIHECIYFATTVLADQRNLLTALDRTTVKLLSENSHVISFQADLHDYLIKLYDEKCRQSKQFKQNEFSIKQTNVCFQVDTDNRENFPSALAFTTFRKQRDLFYEIIKTWEDFHLRPDWNFSHVLSKKINTMLSMHSDAVNYLHIARLFKSQLLVSSIQVGQVDSPVDDETLNFLKSLKDLNPEKLKQLQERLVTPITSMGPVPRPGFPGIQEFYRDFLLTSSNPKFNTILENCLIQEISELNETQFSCSDLETNETKVDEMTKQKYLMCVSNLRILSKFLGYLVSIPFTSEINNLDFINTQVKLRNHVVPSLDLSGYIHEALLNNKLSLTIPWMVQYLAMLDQVSLRLSYYTKICEILYCIYRTGHQQMTQEAWLLIKFSIGWLIEQPNFPKNLYCNWQMRFNKMKIKNITITSGTIKQDPSLSIKETNNHQERNHHSLDKINLIDVRALYICCPFLQEFKVLLTYGKSSFGQGNTANRHITPVSSQLSQPSSETKAKTIQLQLEEAFFHGQQRSVKNTVDFVAERVASSCVKFICRTLVPEIKDKHLLIMKRALDADKGMDKKTTDDSQDTSRMMSDKFPDIVQVIVVDLRNKCDTVVPEMSKTRVKNAIVSLIAEDMHQQVKDMCVMITTRMSLERINQWMDSYVKDAFTAKELYSKAFSMSQKNEDNSLVVEEKIHNDNAPAPTESINAVRNMMWELIEKNGRWAVVNKENIMKILTGLGGSFTERVDLVNSVKVMMYQLSFDFALHVITCSRELFDNDVENEFILIWKICLADQFNQLFDGLMCPRNMKIMSQSRDSFTWRRYGKLIKRLLRDKLVGIEEFSDQCVALFRLEWPVDVMKGISLILVESIDGCKFTDEHSEKIRYFIGWAAEMCTGLDF